ncbi:tigger transposable element-derived protein 6-like protein [Elysia marginata]|uniref:Tigger transposable element-derived protein 6-like protein n=1 Tax=Elysia marginata TaxID=1093978 RepID=A0AAV4JWH1_9GAST|nr:tigger transposable element-derived protein 6-like protein [Elysia marginata]
MRKEQALGKQRALVSEESLRGWFQVAERDFVAEGINIHAATPDQVFNCDETGFPFMTKMGYVLAAKEDRQVYGVTSDNKHQIKVLACGSAAGKMLPPAIIYPGQRLGFDPEAQFPGCKHYKTANGWIDTPTYKNWLQDIFIPATRHLRKPAFLFTDGHTSHVNEKVYFLSKDAGIAYYTLPAHASHILQPLDLVFFKAIKAE